MEKILNVKLGRQLSRATCWAGTVAAIGQKVDPSIRTNAAALIVAEGIQPAFREEDEASKAAFQDEVKLHKDYPNAVKKADERAAKKNQKPKEERDPGKMLKKHFQIITNSDPVAAQPDAKDIIKKIHDSLKLNIPLILGVSNTQPFKYLDPQKGSYTMMHTLLCYGLKDIETDSPVVLCLDPAKPEKIGSALEVPIAQLLKGFDYATVADLGEKFKNEFEPGAFQVKLSTVISVVPPAHLTIPLPDESEDAEI